MLRKQTLLAALLLLLLAAPVLAQDDMETVLDITYDSIVEDTITQRAFFDWWMLQAAAGDVVVINMAASGGLEPLIGILDSGGNLVARSEDGAPDSTLTLEYTTPAAGQYTIVATRVGNADGTSIGAYSLRVRRANGVVENTNPYQDVTFRCEDFEVATAATITFSEDQQAGMIHRITVYGVDGFQPVIRLNVNQPQVFEQCNVDAQQTVGDTFTFPGEETRTITADNLTAASQLILNGAEKAGVITITIGSRDGAPGRYMVIFDRGFAIAPKDDVDMFELRLGPLAAETTSMSVYMIGVPNSRLDPFITLPDLEITCDDAGRRDCNTLPSFTGAGAVLNEDQGATLVGDRSDAGVLLTPGSPDPISVELSSRGGDTHGEYALVVIGELPPRP
jgi:hypothetical protein